MPYLELIINFSLLLIVYANVLETVFQVICRFSFTSFWSLKRWCSWHSVRNSARMGQKAKPIVW